MRKVKLLTTIATFSFFVCFGTLVVGSRSIRSDNNFANSSSGIKACSMHADGGYCPMHDDLKKDEVCPMHNFPRLISNETVAKSGHINPGSTYLLVTSTAQTQGPERPDGSRDTDTHRWSAGDGCSRLDPNASNKDRDGIEPNTVACSCNKKCVNGNVQEDLNKENGVYICRNASHKDRCFCPDPCKT